MGLTGSRARVWVTNTHIETRREGVRVAEGSKGGKGLVNTVEFTNTNSTKVNGGAHTYIMQNCS